MKKLKVLMIGVDGASLSVVETLLRQGELPNLRLISQSGASGLLRSTFPPHTAPGWSSMFTGVNPGKHGVFQFWKTQEPSYSGRPVHSGHWLREPVWSILARHGLRCAVYNVPMTHPPKAPSGGLMISWPLSPTLRYSDPPELISELARNGLHYHSDLITMYKGQDGYEERSASYIEAKTDACLYLCESREIDALFAVFTEVDRISHHYWGGDEWPSETVLATYSFIDQQIGRLLELCDESTIVLVASDHGFDACSSDFNVHRALELDGLFSATDAEPNDTDASWFRGDESMRRSVNWANTAVYMPTPGCFGLNLNLKGRQKCGWVDPGDVGSLTRKVKTSIEAFRDDRGERLFSVVRSSEVYVGPASTEAPDLMLVPKDWSLMPVPSLASELFLQPMQQAVHAPNGIFFARGPNVPKAVSVFSRIEDVTPFLLRQLELPIPENIDGHWLFEAEHPVIRERLPQHGATNEFSPEEADLLNRRLAEIGYFYG